MKINEIITEAEVKPYKFSVMDLDRAVSTLNHYCSQALGMIGAPLWRGLNNHDEPIILIDPSTGKRRSNNTSNYYIDYTELLDNSPYMKGWPKRSASLICSANKDYADGYAKGGYKESNRSLYALYPFDGVKIAMCPGEDMWETEVTIPELDKVFRYDSAMSNFNYWLKNKLFLTADYTEMKISVESQEWADKVIEEDSRSWDPLPRKAVAFISDPATRVTLIDVLQRALSPAQTGFRLLTIDEFIKSNSDSECWVGGPLVAIRSDLNAKFESAMVKNVPPGRPAVPPATVDDPHSSNVKSLNKFLGAKPKKTVAPTDKKYPDPKDFMGMPSLIAQKIKKSPPPAPKLDNEDEDDKILKALGY